MIIYFESNFVLELAFHQEHHESCEAILQLAETKSVELILPAYCIGEPYECLVRRDKQRRDLHRKLLDELQQLSRSAPYTDAASNLRELTGLLVEAGEQEMSQLNNVLVRLLDISTLIPVDRDILGNALQAQRNLGLSPQDSIVYASVRSSVVKNSSEPQCFINKNSKDFLIPEIEEEFSKSNCKILVKFPDGLGYSRSIISKKSK